MNLSVALITKNEERKLRPTLQAVSKIADEIVIVDAMSEDRTAEVASEFGARFYTREWTGFSDQKNHLLEHCKGNWVLLIDADEVLSEALQKEVLEVSRIKPENSNFTIYELRFESYCFGKRVQYGGWSDFYKIRLFAHGSVHFGGEKVHEKFVKKDGARTGHLRGAIEHHTYLDMEECLRKYNAYSTAGALDLFERGRQPRVWRLILDPLWMFIQRYILKRGFLDGRIGLILALFMSYYHLGKYAKLYELHWNRKSF